MSLKEKLSLWVGINRKKDSGRLWENTREEKKSKGGGKQGVNKLLFLIEMTIQIRLTVPDKYSYFLNDYNFISV